MTIVTERKTERKSCPKAIGYYSHDASLLAEPAFGNGERITLKGAIALLEIFSHCAHRAYLEAIDAENGSDWWEFGEAVANLYAPGEFQGIEGLTDDDLGEIWNQQLSHEEWLGLVSWCSDLIQCRLYDARQFKGK